MSRSSAPARIPWAPRASPPAPLALHEALRWYACRTRSRSEKKVGRLLTETGVVAYVPVVEQLQQWSDRSKMVTFPLFPGYVFARFSLATLPQIVRVPNLIEVVRVDGYPTPIRDDEIDAVRALVEGAIDAGVEPSAHDYFVRGQAVEVIQGPFEGLRGILTEVRGRQRIVVRLEAIRQAVSVEMESVSVKPVSGTSGSST